MANAKSKAPTKAPDKEQHPPVELTPEQEEIQRLRAELAKEREEFEAAQAKLEEFQNMQMGATGHGVKLAPNRYEVNRIRDLWVAGGTVSGISQILRIQIKAVQNHIEGFIEEGLVQTGVPARDPDSIAGPKRGMPSLPKK